MPSSSKPLKPKTLAALLAGVALVGCCCLRSCGIGDNSADGDPVMSLPTVTSASASSSEPNPTSPSTSSTPSPIPRRASPATIRYTDCDAVRKAGDDPLFEGEPGYRRALDPDGDGIACDDTSVDDGGADSGNDGNIYYANCSEVRAAGAAPLHRGDPGYSRKLDRDGDGTACE